MPKPELPMAADKIHIRDEVTNTNLAVGQTGQYIYPLSKCHMTRADRRAEAPWGSTDVYDAYYCSYCDEELELYEGHGPEFVEIEKEYNGVTRHVIMVVINNWTGIPMDAYTIELGNDKDTD